MYYDQELLKRMSEILYGHLENYLLSRGWVKKDTKKSYIEFQQSKGKETYSLIIPFDKSFLDYNERLYDALSLISKVENKAILSIFNELVLPPSDIIKIAIEDETTLDGTISFGDGLGVLDAFKKALMSSAYSVENPEKYHKRTYSLEADKFFESCRLGQTEKGSFVATVFCPLDNVQLTLLGGEIEKFGRKATANLIKSLDCIRQSIDVQNLDKLINPSESDHVVSANLCDAILDLRPSTPNYKIKFEVVWANNKKPEGIPSKVMIKSTDMTHILLVSKSLKPDIKEQTDVFIGKVSQLRGEPKDDKMQGEAILVLLDSEENYIRAKVDLDYNNYQKAVKYHASNANITIRGKLVTESARVRRLINFSNFNELKKSE